MTNLWPRRCAILRWPRLTPMVIIVAANRRPSFSPAPTVRVFSNISAAWDEDDQSPIAEADAVFDGRFRYFSGEWLSLGFPPDWHRDPISGQRLPDDGHWSQHR